jgi:hypothetical protein
MKPIFHTICLLLATAFVAPQVGAADGETIYVNPETGADTNPGTKEKPFRTLPAAADRVNEFKGEGAVTVILSPGTYALDRQFSLKANRKYTKSDRLTIRAEVLPDDAKWDTSKMPTLIHTMPLAKRGFTFGMHVETSNVTVHGLKVLGMPGVETPKAGVLNRVYPIGRMDRKLDDLEISQCVFAGDKVTNPNHACVLANGNGINVHHCIFHGVKLTVVYWTPGSTGHSMTNCFVNGAYGSGIWTTENADDFVFRNNVIANGNYVWTYQSGALAQRDPDAKGGEKKAGEKKVVHYKIIDSLFAGNKKMACSGTGANLGFKDIDPSFLELVGTKVSDKTVEVEMDETKKEYLHPVAGSDAAKVGVGLFIKKAEK